MRARLYGALAVRFTASEDHTESPWGERKKAARAREATEVVVGIAESVRRAGETSVPLRWLPDHLDGILNYCRTKVPLGVVEAVNVNIRSLLRRGRAYKTCATCC